MAEHTKHLYEAKTSKRQDIAKRYLTSGKYAVQVLEQEVVTVFCVRCADSKVIYESIGLVDEGEEK